MKTEKPSQLSEVTQQSSGTRTGSWHPSTQQDSDFAEGYFFKNLSNYFWPRRVFVAAWAFL